MNPTGLIALLILFTLSGDALAQTATVEPKPAEDPVWKLSLSARPRAEFRTNNRFGRPASTLRYVKPNDQDMISQRTRLGLGYDSKTFDATFQLQHVGLWGNTGGDQLNDPALNAHQAFFTWTPQDNWWLQVGRFEMAYGDHRVLGNVGWSQVGRAWDGIRTGMEVADGIGGDAFLTFYEDGTAAGAGLLEDDGILIGTYWHANRLNEFLPVIEWYLLGDFLTDRPGDTQPRRALGTFGTRLKGQYSPGALVVEGAYQIGSACVPVAPADPADPPTNNCTDNTIDIGAWFFDTELSADLDFGSSTIKPFLGFGMASGDDPDTAKNEAYFHSYPTAHKFLGYTDIIGPRSNVTEIRGGAQWQYKGLTLRESLHGFWRAQPGDAVGTELDSVATLKVVKEFKVAIGHGLFIPARGVTNDDSDPSGLGNWFFLQLVGNLATTL